VNLDGVPSLGLLSVLQSGYLSAVDDPNSYATTRMLRVPPILSFTRGFNLMCAHKSKIMIERRVLNAVQIP
jgi:hypothetical protein